MVSRHTDRETGASTAVLDLDFQGDEIAETTTRIRRRVWTDDPADLSSPMHYSVEELTPAEAPTDPVLDSLRPAARRVLAVLDSSPDWWTVQTIGDAVAVEDSGRGGLQVRTIQLALVSLLEADLAVFRCPSWAGAAGQWRSARSQGTETEAEYDF